MLLFINLYITFANTYKHNPFMQTLQIPLVFQPEQAAQLRQAYTQLSNALETGGTIDAAQLKATLTEALETQPALGSGGFQRLHDDRARQHLLHLTFAEEESNLLDLPWQLVAEGSPHLLVSKGLPDSPFRGSGGLTEYKPTLPKPLKVLVLIAATDGGGARLSYEAEEKIILDALAPLMRTGEVEVEFTDDGSLESLRRSLANNRFHVLHFSGHGVFTAKKFGETPEAYLMLEDEFSMEARLTAAADFAAVLSADEDRMPALVFLSSCQTGVGGKDGAFRGAAQRLMQAGVPAVVAMGWSVMDFWASHFARVFYEKIARRATLAEAFNQSLAEGRKVQPDWLPDALSHAPQTALHAIFTGQSLIPQLFLTQQLVKFVYWGTASEKRLSRAGLAMLEGKNRIADKLKKIHAVFGRRDEWLFIGRRRERKAALAALRDGRSVSLRGQGGMGKTALALHLAQRRLAADPDGCVPFAFDQTSLSLENICNALLEYLETDCKLRSMRSQATNIEKLWDRFFLLLENVDKQGVTPLFLLDNLESFQTEEGGELKEEVLELFDYLLNRLGYPVICTGRYPLREFGEQVLHPVDLNQAPFGDFKQKCLHLPALRQLEVPGRSLDETLRTLHQSLGGNYRSLEDFDELCRNNAREAPATLDALDKLISDYAGEALQNRAQDLVFGKLLALLSPAEATALTLLAQFNRPVLPFALEWQPQSPGEAKPLCSHLADLTLAERRTWEAEGHTYFFVPPLVRELLAKAVTDGDLTNLTLDDERAGAYFENVKFQDKLNIGDIEEAFFHYERAKKVDEVNDLGDYLSKFYYENEQFHKSLIFAKRTEVIAGLGTDSFVLNRLGLLLGHYGKFDAALSYFEFSLAKDRVKNDKEGEGTILDNIGQIYGAKGDYDKALAYSLESLNIRQEISDRKGEGRTLNNLATTVVAKGEYEIAIGYLQRSLKIMQEIGDRDGEGTTLNNFATIAHAKGDYDKELEYLLQSLEIQQEIGDRKGEGATMNNLATNSHAKGDYDMALDYFEQCLKIQQEIGDRNGEGMTLNNISQIYDARGDYETALVFLQQSLKIMKEIGSKQREALALNNIGQIHSSKGYYETAVEYLHQSLKIRLEIGDKPGEAMSLNNLAAIAYFKGNYEMALDYFQQSLIITKEIGDRNAEGVALNNISQIHSLKGEDDTALFYSSQSLKIMQEIGNRSGEGTAFNNIAAIYLAKGSNDLAYDNLLKSLKIVQEIGYRKMEGTLLSNIGQIHSNKGEYAAALDYFQKSLKILEEVGAMLDLATTISNMGVLFFKQNQIEAALPLFVQAYQILHSIGSPDEHAVEEMIEEIIVQIGQVRFEEILQNKKPLPLISSKI